ncbi:MAG: HAD family phosphatase [Clostridia bacterium]|nr:HAD family phosphatase [Clostridia bacterium]
MNKEILDAKELFIFDLDGTVCDTEPCHHAAYVRTIEMLCPGHTIPPEEFLSCYVGHSETEIYRLLKKNKNIDFDDELFFKTRIENLFDIVNERKLDCALFYRQLEKMYPDKRFIALTSQRVFVLDRFRKIIDYGKIKEFISVADKPYEKKDVLADTEKYLGVAQSKAVIFEDFSPTLCAARENGVYAVGVCHSFNSLSTDVCDELIDIHKEISFS